MPEWIEVRDYFYRNPDGTVRQERWIGSHRLWVSNPAPVVVIDWSSLEAAWTTLVKVPCALVKEGPKAIVKYGG